MAAYRNTQAEFTALCNLPPLVGPARDVFLAAWNDAVHDLYALFRAALEEWLQRGQVGFDLFDGTYAQPTSLRLTFAGYQVDLLPSVTNLACHAPGGMVGFLDLIGPAARLQFVCCLHAQQEPFYRLQQADRAVAGPLVWKLTTGTPHASDLRRLRYHPLDEKLLLDALLYTCTQRQLFDYPEVG